MKTEFRGDILSVRAVEDCIRATKKYTKGAFRKSPSPGIHIQGGYFPSRTVTEYYEVYPKVELSWDMTVSKLCELTWGDHVDVRFQYDYRDNTALIRVYGGMEILSKLYDGIPGLAEALGKIQQEEAQIERYNKQGIQQGDQEPPVQRMDRSHRVRPGFISNP